MENNKFWIYLVLGVVAAMSLKMWVTSDSSLPTKRWSISANMDDEIKLNRSARHSDKVAGLSNSRRSTELVEVKSGTTTTAPALAATAKTQSVTKLENKAKKKDDKKKKKKHRKAKVIGVPGSTDSQNTSDDSHDKSAAAPTTAASPLAFQSGLVGGAPNEIPKTLNEWEKILLPWPNHRETIRFISLYQTKQITSEVFYGIITQMLTDGRTQMRELGIMSLGATPSLQSYTMLVTAAELEHGVVKTEAAGYLEETYSRPQSINVIYAALTQADVATATQLQALKNLDTIVTNSRAPSSQPASADAGVDTPAPTKNESVTQQRVLEYFRLLQGPLAKLSSSSSDAQIHSLASTVLSHITVALETPAVDPSTVAAQ